MHNDLYLYPHHSTTIQIAAAATTTTTAATTAAATTNNHKAGVKHLGVQGTLHKRSSNKLPEGGLVLALQGVILKAQVDGWEYCTPKENHRQRQEKNGYFSHLF